MDVLLGVFICAVALFDVGIRKAALLGARPAT
jgi:hypothetical protein